MLGRARDDVEDDRAILMRRGDVKETQLIRAFPVIGLGDFNGIAGVAQVKKLYSLDDAAGVYIQAGNDALC